MEAEKEEKEKAGMDLGDFVSPDVVVKEELLWKAKNALAEYSKLMHGIGNTLSEFENSAEEAKSAEKRASEVDALFAALDALKPSEC